jgi:hypothetical protein
VPCLVYGPGRDGTADGCALTDWLHDHKVPQSVSVMIDMETYIDNLYVDRVYRMLANPVLLYGSLSTVFGNGARLLPALGDGWWPADWTGHPHLFAHQHVPGTQYAAEQLGQTAGPWDLSLISPDVDLWQPGDDPYPLVRITANGRDSLAQIVARHQTEASTILRITLGQEPGAKFPPGLAAYINRHNLDEPVPAGTILWLRDGQ